MAEPELENLDAEEDAKAKKPSPVGSIIGIVVVTVIAVGAGWFLGGQFAAKPKKMEMAKVEQKNVPKEDEAGEEEGKDGKKVDLGPIVKTGTHNCRIAQQQECISSTGACNRYTGKRGVGR